MYKALQGEQRNGNVVVSSFNPNGILDQYGMFDNCREYLKLQPIVYSPLEKRIYSIPFNVDESHEKSIEAYFSVDKKLSSDRYSTNSAIFQQG